MHLRLRTRLAKVIAAASFAAAMLFDIGQSARAVTVGAGTIGGLMMQPSSSYFHAVYGGYIDVASNTQSLIGRGAWIERPKFSANGYTDQDYGGFISAGTKLTKGKSHGLFAFFGFGRMGGFIRSSNPGDEVSERTFSMQGPTASLEYALQWKNLTTSIGHSTFIGFGDRNQTEAYVAWPWNFGTLQIGFNW